MYMGFTQSFAPQRDAPVDRMKLVSRYRRDPRVSKIRIKTRNTERQAIANIIAWPASSPGRPGTHRQQAYASVTKPNSAAEANIGLFGSTRTV